jgi:hypothetical protein
MKITQKELKKVCNFIDRIEKVDFTKLDIDNLFENIDLKTKLKIRNDYKGVENLKILRLLMQLKPVRKRYNIKLKKNDIKKTIK